MSHNNVKNSNGKNCPIRILILGSGFLGIEVLEITKETSEKQQHRHYFGKPR